MKTEFIKIKRRDRLTITSLVVLAALATALTELYIYDAAKSRLEYEIKQKLVVGAYSTAYILGEQYHDGLLKGTRTISKTTEYRDAQRLTNFAQRSEFAYVYSMIMRNNQILFVSSSVTPQELSEHQAYEAVFLTDYEDAPDALYQAFFTGEITTSEYTDQWGTFSSVFVPMMSIDGTLYVVGVDMGIDEFNNATKLDMLVTLMPLFLVVLLAIPITSVLVRALNRQAGSEISRLFQDRLTGLANRNKLASDLEQAAFPAMFMMNIDRFREISNTFGPAVGDKVLAEFGHHISCFHHPKLSQLNSYRLQGDEFALLVDQKIESEDRHEIVGALYEYINSFVYTSASGRLVSLSVTLGGSVNQADAFLLADMALRHAKYFHKDLVIYDDQLGIPEIYKQNLDRVEMLRLALEQGRVVPYFQPISRVSDGGVERYEVLARVVDDQGSIIMSPLDFIPLAERYRLHGRVTKAILDKTLERMKYNDHHVCINISIRNIEDPDLSKYIISSVKKSGFARRISFELLEHESMRNPKVLVKFFVKIRRMGGQVGIDDLGKEYSNFDRLMELPIDFIKIDGAVIHHIARDSAAFEILRRIVSASHSRGIETVAECIDSKEMEAVATRLDVHYMQGFYLGIPTADFAVAPMHQADTNTGLKTENA